MIVYGSCQSPFVRKVLFFLEEKGLVYDHVPLAPHDPSDAFRLASPLGKVPGFSDGTFHLADSSAICHYVERKYPDPAMFPEDAERLGRMIWFEEMADTVLADITDRIVLNLVIKPRLLKQVPDLAVVDRAFNEELPTLFDMLEQEIDGPFLIGDRLSLADVALACPFVDLTRVGRPLDGQRWRKLASYLEAIHARPAFAAISDV